MSNDLSLKISTLIKGKFSKSDRKNLKEEFCTKVKFYLKYKFCASLAEKVISQSLNPIETLFDNKIDEMK